MTAPTGPSRFQFSLARILWAMLVCAVLSAVVRALGLPTVLQVPLLVLLVFYAAYAIFRLPYMLGDVRGQSENWRRIRERRQTLQKWIDNRRTSADENTTAELPRAPEADTAESRLLD